MPHTTSDRRSCGHLHCRFSSSQHGEDFEERVRLASEAMARFDLYVELLCLEAVDLVVVEYLGVSVGWVQQQRSSSSRQQQLEQHERGAVF